ncbi:MAG: DUF3391 domain-containing protein, partial [Cellvibrionaceae bacterium]|nr:DUF3391 domain-containing protein [Cellvibrionaceae bacterium]
MRLVEIPAISLKPGMFVAELDRPWLETPFAIQGFVVRDRNEIEYISKYVNNVYVDIDYAGSRVFLPNCASDTEREASFSGHSRLKADFQQAKISFESASQAMERVFKSMQSRQTASIQAVRQAIRPLVQDIFKNKEAATALAKLKSDSDYRYHHSIA